MAVASVAVAASVLVAALNAAAVNIGVLTVLLPSTSLHEAVCNIETR